MTGRTAGVVLTVRRSLLAGALLGGLLLAVFGVESLSSSALSVPSVTVPSVTVPSVTVPSVPVPTPPVATPPVSTPPVSTPPVSTPPVSTPPVSTPPVSTPHVSTPSGSPPSVGSPAGGSTPSAAAPRVSGTPSLASSSPALSGAAGSGAAGTVAAGARGSSPGTAPTASLSLTARRETARRAAAENRQLRTLVARLSGCLSTLPRAERTVLVLRAGSGTAPPRASGTVAHVLRLSIAREARLEHAALVALQAAARGGSCGQSTTAIAPVASYGIVLLTSPLAPTATQLSSPAPGRLAKVPNFRVSQSAVAPVRSGTAIESAVIGQPPGSATAWILGALVALGMVAFVAGPRHRRGRRERAAAVAAPAPPPIPPPLPPEPGPPAAELRAASTAAAPLTAREPARPPGWLREHASQVLLFITAVGGAAQLLARGRTRRRAGRSRRR